MGWSPGFTRWRHGCRNGRGPGSSIVDARRWPAILCLQGISSSHGCGKTRSSTICPRRDGENARACARQVVYRKVDAAPDRNVALGFLTDTLVWAWAGQALSRDRPGHHGHLSFHEVLGSFGRGIISKKAPMGPLLTKFSLIFNAS